jgi:hypothetical protein
MVHFACRSGNTVGNALRGVSGRPNATEGVPYRDFTWQKCYLGLNHAEVFERIGAQ